MLRKPRKFSSFSTVSPLKADGCSNRQLSDRGSIRYRRGRWIIFFVIRDRCWTCKLICDHILDDPSVLSGVEVDNLNSQLNLSGFV